MTEYIKDCLDTEDEREKLFDLVDKLPLCRKALYETAQAKLDSGMAQTRREAERQIARETGRKEETIHKSIQREQRERLGTLSPIFNTPSQAEEVYSLPACPLPHVAHNTGDNEWYTPPDYIQAAKEVMGGIDLDPASSEIANKSLGAARFFTADDDGLSQHWTGRIWLNPPYAGDLIGKFCNKLHGHWISGNIESAIVLVNNATETSWFNILISIASAVVFPKSRIRFLDPQGNPGAPLQGQAVIYIGKSPDGFIKIFSCFGWGAIVVV